MLTRHLRLAAILGLLTSTACGRRDTSPDTPVISKVHAQALAYVARGVALADKDPAEGVRLLKLAVQLEPENREWKGHLAFTLHHRAKNTEEAIAIWRDLAKGSDKEAEMAGRWLKKVGATTGL